MDFVKMHGTGNDYVVVDGRQAERDWPTLARAMCDRHFGVGADGLLIVADSDAAPLRMRMLNPDGSESEMCGNGLRCFVKYAAERCLVEGPRFAVETGAGVVNTEHRRDGAGASFVRLDMGAPRLAAREVPVNVTTPGPVKDLPLSVGGHSLLLTCVSMGNPHAVAFIDEPVERFPLFDIGPKVEVHELFPNRVNFHVARVIDRGHVEMRPWERGAGPTLSCGSGAAAVAVAARLHDLIDDNVAIDLPGGQLELSWRGEGPVELSGPAVEVFGGAWPD